MGHGYWHIPLSARQLAGRAQIRDVQLLGNVVRVSDQVFAIVVVCALATLALSSLFLLEFSAFCTREFFCHGRQAFSLLFLLFLLLLLFFFLFVVVIVVGIIVVAVTGLTGRKIIPSGW
jgi:hypothetical protein